MAFTNYGVLLLPLPAVAKPPLPSSVFAKLAVFTILISSNTYLSLVVAVLGFLASQKLGWHLLGHYHFDLYQHHHVRTVSNPL
jgi:hypothetical protein